MTACASKYYEKADIVLDKSLRCNVTLGGIAAYSVAALVIGTGGNFDLSQYRDWPEHFKARIPFQLHEANTSSTSSLDARRIEDHLANIKSVLSLSITDLSHMFGVSRQAFYKWQSGDAYPEAGNTEAIVKVSNVADRLNAAGVSRARHLVKMKIFDGRSLVELVKHGSFEMNDIDRLIDESRRMEDSYKKSSVYKSNTQKHDDWMTDSSLPSLEEQ